MNMPTPDLIASIASTVGVGVAIVIVLMRTIARLDRRIDESGADRRAFQAEAARDRAEAAQDRRAWQASMDTFRAEMQRLAERQSRVEGTQEIHNRAHGTAD